MWGLDVVDGGWVDRDTGDRIDTTGRTLVLAYGSNADPTKLSERLMGTVLVLRCLVRDRPVARQPRLVRAPEDWFERVHNVWVAG